MNQCAWTSDANLRRRCRRLFVSHILPTFTFALLFGVSRDSILAVPFGVVLGAALLSQFPLVAVGAAASRGKDRVLAAMLLVGGAIYGGVVGLLIAAPMIGDRKEVLGAFGIFGGVGFVLSGACFACLIPFTGKYRVAVPRADHAAVVLPLRFSLLKLFGATFVVCALLSFARLFDTRYEWLAGHRGDPDDFLLLDLFFVLLVVAATFFANMLSTIYACLGGGDQWAKRCALALAITAVLAIPSGGVCRMMGLHRFNVFLWAIVMIANSSFMMLSLLYFRAAGYRLVAQHAGPRDR